MVVSVDVLEPTIEELVQVIAVVLALATLALGCSCGAFEGQASSPAIVGSSRQNDVVAVVPQSFCKELGTRADVEVRVTAIPPGCATALLMSDLHQALFSSTSDSVGVA